MVLEEAPTVLILGITPPTDDGGAPVIGYRVEYDTNHMDFTMCTHVLQVITIECVTGRMAMY